MEKNRIGAVGHLLLQKLDPVPILEHSCSFQKRLELPGSAITLDDVSSSGATHMGHEAY